MCEVYVKASEVERIFYWNDGPALVIFDSMGLRSVIFLTNEVAERLAKASEKDLFDYLVDRGEIRKGE